MNRLKFLSILLSGFFFIVLQACIEPFTPEIGDGNQYLVINGVVSDEEGYQYAEISTASSYNNREFNPINNCQAKIIDHQGNVFEMEHFDEGKYRTWIDKQYLQTGNKFKIEVVLNEGKGKRYESEFDTLLPCPDMDTIYSEIKNIVPDDPMLPSEEGIQLYIDFDATGDFAKNYRWEAIETWEYLAKNRIMVIYNGIDENCCPPEPDFVPRPGSPCDKNPDTCLYSLNIDFLDEFSTDPRMDSLFRCYKTNKTTDIFTYTSSQKNDKKVRGLPLNLITNKDNRLTVKYSVLVKQLALSDNAFKYWNHLQLQLQESGGLYETQPYELEGNIKCIDDEDETVIGLFSTSSVKTKRFIGFFHFKPSYSSCAGAVSGFDETVAYLWGADGPWDSPPRNLSLPPAPLYLEDFGERIDTFALPEQSCYDCRLKGGTLTKPDYW